MEVMRKREEFLKNEEDTRFREREERLREELAKEFEIHTKTRSEMIIKCFAEKVCPAVHDAAAKKEAIGEWKQEFMTTTFLQREQAIKTDAAVKLIEQERLLEEQAKERATHTKARRGMIIKFFSEKFSPEIHDKSAKREGFGFWKEQSMHEKFTEHEQLLKEHPELLLEEEAKLREEHETERTMHAKSRSAMIVKYFADKIAPAVHDMGSKKESFGLWKEEFVHVKFSKWVIFMENEAKKQDAENDAKNRELAKEHEIHRKTRGDMVMKLFSEKISPRVYDAAFKREGFGGLKEEFLHGRFQEREEFLKKGFLQAEAQLEEAEKLRQEQAKEREVHAKARSDMIMNFFAEKFSPEIHDGDWQEQCMQKNFDKEAEKRLEVEMALAKQKEEEESRKQEDNLDRELEQTMHALHNKSRSDMIIKLFSEKVSPGIHDLGAKKEGFGMWKEDFMGERLSEAKKAHEKVG
jgi:hypothetical protein